MRSFREHAIGSAGGVRVAAVEWICGWVTVGHGGRRIVSFSMSRTKWITHCVFVSTTLGICSPWWVYCEEKQSAPALYRHPERLIGASVVQKRGWVRDAEDVGDLLRKGYWELDDKSAVGVVNGFRPDGTLDVEFRDSTGWSRVDFQVQKVERTKVSVDRYGQELNVEKWTEEGVKVDPADHGLIIQEDGERRIVRFPINCLALAPLQKGDKVIRGPDWNRGFTDGGDTPEGDAIVSPALFGLVIEEADADNYVLIEWDSTGIREKCRYDCRRRYDVKPISTTEEK